MSNLSISTIRTIKTILQLYADLTNKMLVPSALVPKSKIYSSPSFGNTGGTLQQISPEETNFPSFFSNLMLLNS